jgi:type II secretory pathway component PulC
MQLKSLLDLLRSAPENFWQLVIYILTALFFFLSSIFMYGSYVENVKTYLDIITEKENSFINEMYEYHDENDSNIKILFSQTSSLKNEINVMKKNGKA